MKKTIALLAVIFYATIALCGGTEYIKMSVGEKRTLSLPSSVTSKTLRTWSWNVVGTYSVKINSKTVNSCTIEGLSETSSSGVIVQFYYEYLVTSGSYTYSMSDYYDFNIVVSGGASTTQNLQLDYYSISVDVGVTDLKLLNATVSPVSSDETISWRSSNTAVLTVKSGTSTVNGQKKFYCYVTTKTAGSATITATSSSGASASCTVTVLDHVYICVFFNPNGGEVNTTSKSYVQGEVFGNLPTPSRQGYSFAGWYTDTELHITTSSIVPSHDINLYAHWGKNITITLDPSGGTINSTSLERPIGETYGSLPSPTKEGFSFGGWFTDEGLEINTESVVPQNNIVLHAKWLGVFKISFDPNGGTLDCQSMTFVEGNFPNSMPIPTRKGYAFVCWLTEEGKDISTQLPRPQTDIKLIAKWRNAITILSSDWQSSTAGMMETVFRTDNLIDADAYNVGFSLEDVNGTEYIIPMPIIQDPTKDKIVISSNGVYRVVWDALTALKSFSQTVKQDEILSIKVLLHKGHDELDLNGHVGVRLWDGGPFFAKFNIGSSTPESFGYYFWWGDTVGYFYENRSWISSDGSVTNFSFNEDSAPTRNRTIDYLESNGWIKDGELAPIHDAATVHWGEGWRIPSSNDIDQLSANCDFVLATNNNTKGMLIKGKGSFSNAEIFIPNYSGRANNTSLDIIASTFWTSTPCSDDSRYTWRFSPFSEVKLGRFYDGRRHFGMPIRPVADQVANEARPSNVDYVMASAYYSDPLFVTISPTSSIPKAWFLKYFPNTTDYENKANCRAANGSNSIEESYVIGIDPTNKNDKFQADISLNGRSVFVTWKPYLNSNGVERVYKVKSASSLSQKVWNWPATETDTFFRVEVSLPTKGSNEETDFPGHFSTQIDSQD